MRWIVAVVALLLAVAGAALWAGLWRLPERYDPWAPLRLAEPPGLLTRYKLSRLAADPAACLQALAQSGFRYAPLPDRETAPGCGFSGAVRIDRSGLQPNAPFSLSCPAAVSLALWERHVVLPAAERRFGEPVVRLEHYGSYACRNVYGRDAGSRSQHATADALDIAAFVLKSGRRIRIATDWHGEGPAAAFLHEIRDGACKTFDAVLGPDYNAAHADHLHFDRGRYATCR